MFLEAVKYELIFVQLSSLELQKSSVGEVHPAAAFGFLSRLTKPDLFHHTGNS